MKLGKPVITWSEAKNLLKVGLAKKVMIENPRYDDVYFDYSGEVIRSCAMRPERRPPRLAPDKEYAEYRYKITQ